jgi:membrane protease subunit HflC
LSTSLSSPGYETVPVFLVVVVFFFVVMVLFRASTVVTHPGEYRIVRQFGKIVRVDTSESHPYGLGFKIPFIQSDSSISNKLMLYDLPPSDVMTSDKKSMTLTVPNTPCFPISTLLNMLFLL